MQHTMMRSPLKDKYAVVLCGGRGSRLGSITDTIPKSLVKVHGKPILWYTFLSLYKYGIRRFICPLGYKGQMIKDFVSREFKEYEEFREYDWDIRFFDTGTDTPVAQRLGKVVSVIPEHDDFLLLNGDTLFDFNIIDMYYLHVRKNALVTLSSTEIVSNYGIIIERHGDLVSFVRDSKISYMATGQNGNTRGFVNAGLSLIKKDALDLIDLETCSNFEIELYPKVIRMRRAAHYKIDGSWFAIDTPKDLNIINLQIETRQEIGHIMKEIKKNLANRYSYRTRYYNNANEIKEKILSKTVIPHQVEVQPGPTKGALCWLKCPYCYGNSAKDSGERLSPERYIEVMKQIAKGGVNKVVFAGYATDPLNYEYIEDIHRIALDYGQIFGFHTKALKISDRLINQITSSSIASLSYFSVSVDAGFNQTYNEVHGIGKSKANLYDRVRKNVHRVFEAREKTGAPLDISVTYLINSYNNSIEEVRKAIGDFRDAGADLIRFTFPQVPRGYKKSLQEPDPFIPRRDEVLADMNRLRPIIETENKSHCQVLLLDLDADYETYLVPRTLPCFARFVFPCIGFDGWLSHCSESSAPHFRKMALGNLNNHDFWDIFYNYDTERFSQYMKEASDKMTKLSCKCDRKEHVVNEGLRINGISDEFI